MKQLHSLNHKGLTLVEVLVSVAIVSGVSMLLATLHVDLNRFTKRFNTALTSVDRAQRLLRPMTAEIRSASMSGLGAFPVAVAYPYEFAFYSDIDSDTYKEYVRYYLSGTTLYKEVIHQNTGTPPSYPTSGSTTAFIEGVQNETTNTPLFRFFSNEYVSGSVSEITSADTDIDKIRMVRVSIVLQPQESVAPTTLTSDVSIRNLKQQ